MKSAISKMLFPGVRRFTSHLAFGLLLAILASTFFSGETCEIRRQDVSVPRVCGRVSYDDGKRIEGVELRLTRNNDEVVASTRADSTGEFNFDAVQKGDYHLVADRSAKWAGVRWQVKVTKSNYKSINNECGRRIYVVLSPQNQTRCQSWMTTKKPKFNNAQTH
ncbi:MAG: hypothetical protein DMG93_17715 [Acidobacteria bacterium]|nr:MAG: hypothetical protein DMG93_17715 [Acidobacteriota bacterium]